MIFINQLINKQTVQELKYKISFIYNLILISRNITPQTNQLFKLFLFSFSQMQPDIYYFKIFPKKIVIHKSIIYSVHPLTKFRVLLFRNLDVCDAMKNWVYAGTHNGVINIQSSPLDMIMDSTERTNFFTIKLFQIKYNLQKSDVSNNSNSSEKQQMIGKHSLFVKNYITKFKFQNTHFFQEQAQISTDFVLHYEVFVQKTLEGLDKIVFEHQMINFQNRPKRNSQIQSVQSSAFSDKINQIEVRGQNRFAHHASQLLQNPLVGSQSKLSIQNFSSLNLKKGKLARTKNPSNMAKMYNAPSTQRKNKQLKQQKKPQRLNQQQMIQPPELQPLELKKLTSQQIKINFELFSPRKLTKKKPALLKDSIDMFESNQMKKRKLLQDFEIKRLQFKKKLLETKSMGLQLPTPKTDRRLKRSNSTRSMKSVKLSEWEKLPQQKPWVRKQNEKAKSRNKKIMYFIIVVMLFLLYIAMQPNKNIQIQRVQIDKEVEIKIKSEKKNKVKKQKSFNKK